MNSERVVPLSIDGAQGYGPEVWAEPGQLGDVVCHLQHATTNSDQNTVLWVVYIENTAKIAHQSKHKTNIFDTHLPSRHVLGGFVQPIDVGAEGLKVRDDKLLSEGLGEQDDVALDTSGTGGEKIES